MKIGRVGGLTRAKAIHDLCQQQGIPVWCGGMLELGVGRAHNIAIASLPNFSIAGDTSASSRSFSQDIVTPEVAFLRPGILAVPTGPGIGYEVDRVPMEKFTLRKGTFRPSARKLPLMSMVLEESSISMSGEARYTMGVLAVVRRGGVALPLLLLRIP